ncbi:MAG TPA: dihydrofolate reductase family protein [Ktedonobacterales bacterium]|nr:dihydrofolate reductase family protein [Ktedonobacterales bacterium]
MGNVVVGATMSLDGFIAGPNDAMDWVFAYSDDLDAPNKIDEYIIQSTGAVLVGRRCYDVGQRAARPELSGLYGGRWVGPEFVLTHRPPVGGSSSRTTFLSGDIRQAVATALEAANGKNLLVLGGNVVSQCLDADLVDEVLLHLAPILLGEGVQMFSRSGQRQITLETVNATQVGQLTDLHFRVSRS